MLADGKINSLDSHLEQFKLKNQAAQTDLQNLLREYGQLLGDYKALKRIYESLITNKSNVKPVAKATGSAEEPRNPYVLVLVDGNGYIFNDELIREKEEGGMRAARMLNEAVEKYISQSVPNARTSRIVVRIYADLTNLSKQLAKSKVTGLEKRSIAPFSAAFTRAFGSFDFIDTLDEEGTKFKIREQITFATEDTACSHIFYAACHDSAYLSQVVPLSSSRDKITLVQGAGWLSDFHQFNLNITQFPTVFRWSELPPSHPITKASNGATLARDKAVPKGQFEPWSKNSTHSGTSSLVALESSSVSNNDLRTNAASDSVGGAASSQQLCKYFQKGFCRYGNKCTFQHVPPTLTDLSRPTTKPPIERSNISSRLPQTMPLGFIPLNKDQERLDTYIRPPTQSEWAIYNTRFHKQKPCNAFHLQRECTNFGCPYDHNELEPEARHVLEYVLRCQPCPKRSECRAAECFYGHVCQKDGCTGQMKGCRMKADLHAVEPRLASMVPAEEDEEGVLGHDNGVRMPEENEYMW